MSETEKKYGDFSDLRSNRARIELDLSKTPEEHIKVAVETNPEFLGFLFNTEDLRRGFIEGRIPIDSENSSITLMDNNENIKSFDLKRPFSEQLENELKVSDDVPEFLVSVKMSVG